MNRIREIRIMPVCEPAETTDELLFQIEVLVQSYEKFQLKKQIKEIQYG